MLIIPTRTLSPLFHLIPVFACFIHLDKNRFKTVIMVI